MADEQLPDVYADGLSISAGPAGMTITLLLSQPQVVGSPQGPKAIGRVRMSLELGEELVKLTRTAIDNGRKLPMLPLTPLLPLIPPVETEGASGDEA